MSRKPTVIEVTPHNYANEVDVETSIRATFSIDMDPRYMSDFVYLQDEEGNRIEGRVKYGKRVVTFTPHQPLKKQATYNLFLIGDSNLSDEETVGLRSIIGIAMAGVKIIRFTTMLGDQLLPPTAKFPMNNSVIRLKPVFEWSPVEGNEGYGIQISKTNTFNTLVYPLDDETTISGELLEPDVELEDGHYYWRIRTIQAGGETSIWSRILQFHFATSVEGKISHEDADEIDSTDDPSFYEITELEFIEAFPSLDSIQVKTNVETLYFRLLGDIDLEALDIRSLTLTGEHISEDYEEESHGPVKGRTVLVESDDGTVYVLFTPEPLSQGEEVEV